MKENGQVVKVSIFGHDYPIRAKVEDEDYVRAIAHYIDAKMREIQETMQPSSEMKVAILTALNIADELMTLRRERNDIMATFDERVRDVSEALDQALNG